VESFKELNQATFAWLMGAQQKYAVKDFGFVFERYLKT
ncbi:MAG: YvbH-like oligomerization domain-containing protein, partial [Cystobacter sp.]